jgi:hypothetical protein
MGLIFAPRVGVEVASPSPFRPICLQAACRSRIRGVDERRHGRLGVVETRAAAIHCAVGAGLRILRESRFYSVFGLQQMDYIMDGPRSA